MTARERLAVAYHESGHAIAHWALGVPFLSVSIIPMPDEGTSGRVLVLEKTFEVNRPDGARKVIDEAVIHVSGPLAQRRVFEPGLECCADYSKALRALMYLDGDADAALEEAEAEAGALIEREWPNVELVACALLIRQRLSAGDVRVLLDD